MMAVGRKQGRASLCLLLALTRTVQSPSSGHSTSVTTRSPSYNRHPHTAHSFIMKLTFFTESGESMFLEVPSGAYSLPCLLSRYTGPIPLSLAPLVSLVGLTLVTHRQHTDMTVNDVKGLLELDVSTSCPPRSLASLDVSMLTHPDACVTHTFQEQHPRRKPNLEASRPGGHLGREEARGAGLVGGRDRLVQSAKVCLSSLCSLGLCLRRPT